METKAIRSSWVVLLGAALLFGAAEAAAQGSPAPGANQAFLYELDEDAVLLNAAGNVLMPDMSGTSPTGLVDATNGAVGIPAIRHATSQLQGVAMLGSLLCPYPQEVTVGTKDCRMANTVGRTCSTGSTEGCTLPGARWRQARLWQRSSLGCPGSLPTTR